MIKVNLAAELQERGMLVNHSADPAIIFGSPRTVYVGMDPTADSLHAGNLVHLVTMKRLSDAGHKLIFLVGGATGMIGDPKEKGERSLLGEEVLARNVEALRKQVQGILGEKTPFEMVNNADWLTKIDVISFLRDIGKHFSVNDLIKRDTIKRRLDTPNESISYTEFSYALLQGYDFLELHKKYGCDLQIGGNDQWTNILSGVDLVRRKEGKEVFAFASPLITDAAGKKFGKSEGNAIWLDAVKMSPYKFYQFWLNTEDEMVIDYLKYFSFYTLPEIGEIAQARATEKPRYAQEKLAFAMTEFVHGVAAAQSAEKMSGIIFNLSDIQFGDSSTLSAEELQEVLQNVPTHTDFLEKNLVDVLVESGLSKSKREAREFIETGAITIDGEKQTDVDYVFPKVVHHSHILKRGKRQVVVLASVA